MTALATIAQSVQKNRLLTSEHVYEINNLLLQRQYTEADLQILDRLIEALIARQVESTSPVLNLFLEEIPHQGKQWAI